MNDSGRHVFRITLQVTEYEYPPVPANFREAWVVSVFVDDRIDREGLVNELEEVLRGTNFVLTDRWEHTS
jgi:hypothetical protein